MKISRQPVDPKYFGHYVNNLWSAFVLMDDKEQIRKLFRDLFTHTEYKMFTKRLEIGRRLLVGQTYQEIKEDLKVTERTIANISNILERDGEGLRIAHKKLSEIDKHLQREKEKRQNRLERKTRPRLSGEDVLLGLVKAGVSDLNKIVSKKIKHSSSKRQLLG